VADGVVQVRAAATQPPCGSVAVSEHDRWGGG
jgi:hypothetical protein